MRYGGSGEPFYSESLLFWVTLKFMTIETVILVPGTQMPVGEGINQPARWLVRYADGTSRRAIVKQLTPEGVAAEAFCALLLRGWGLSVPEPAIVDDPIAFASVDAGYPDLKQKIGWSETLPDAVKQQLIVHGSRLVANFADTPRALSLDEAIQNRDRNLGNILWDGANVAWIDHDRALGLGQDADANKLAHMAVLAGLGYAKIQEAAVAVALTLVPGVVASVVAECGPLPVRTFAEQVSSRLGGLATRVLYRFPQPRDLLNP